MTLRPSLSSSRYVELADPSNPTGAVKADSTMDDYNRYFTTTALAFGVVGRRAGSGTKL